MTKNDVSDTGISQKLAEVHDRISAAGVSNEDLDIILAAVVALASRHPQPVNEPVEWQVEKAARAIHWEQYEDPAQAEHEWNHWAGSADYARKLARSALRAASIPAPERSKGDTGGELPDNIRVPLHSLQADVDYLFGRVAADGAWASVVAASVKERLAQIEAALETPPLHKEGEAK